MKIEQHILCILEWSLKMGILYCALLNNLTKSLRIFRNVSKHSVLDFSFYCLVSEEHLVTDALQYVIDQGILGQWFLDGSYPRTIQNPGKIKLTVSKNIL